MNQVLTKVWVEKDRRKEGVFYVQSFNPRKKQLSYTVVLKPFDDEVHCTCDAFKYNPGLVCKHIMRVVEFQGGLVAQWK